MKGLNIVYLPYTELLDSDSSPKHAKEIWTILSKAGVTRFAELVWSQMMLVKQLSITLYFG